MMHSLNRREFAAGLLATPLAIAQNSGPHLGTLYPTVQAIADSSPRSLSFLRPEYSDLTKWQTLARRRLFDLLHYSPAPVRPEPQLISRTPRDGFIEEQITFRTTPHARVPATVLLPLTSKGRAPAVVVLHDHGGFYMWGREKVVAGLREHPVLATFKQRAYGGRSIANELVRQGYVVIAIDMFYWGERRHLLPEDPPAVRNRTADLTAEQIDEFHERSSRSEQLIARSLMTAGSSWPGVMLWDDIRTVDYLASRPEVDPDRIACVGLSVGGYRSFLLAALDPRIKVAVDVGWMTTFAPQIERHVIHTMGLSFLIPGMYRYFDFPELSALIPPRALMVIMGSRDSLFPLPAMRSAFRVVEQCYTKAGSRAHQRCRMYDAPHEFNPAMQSEAWQWLKQWI